MFIKLYKNYNLFTNYKNIIIIFLCFKKGYMLDFIILKFFNNLIIL